MRDCIHFDGSVIATVDIPCDPTPAIIKATVPCLLDFEEVIFERLQALNGYRTSMVYHRLFIIIII